MMGYSIDKGYKILVISDSFGFHALLDTEKELQELYSNDRVNIKAYRVFADNEVSIEGES